MGERREVHRPGTAVLVDTGNFAVRHASVVVVRVHEQGRSKLLEVAHTGGCAGLVTGLLEGGE